MTSRALKTKVRATRAYQELCNAALYTQFEGGIIDCLTLEECESIIERMKVIHREQMEIIFGEEV